MRHLNFCDVSRDNVGAPVLIAIDSFYPIASDCARHQLDRISAVVEIVERNLKIIDVYGSMRRSTHLQDGRDASLTKRLWKRNIRAKAKDRSCKRIKSCECRHRASRSKT